MILDIVFAEVRAELAVEFSGDSMDFDVTLDAEEDLMADFGEVNVIVSDAVPRYDGPHEVNPTFTDQVLDTSGLLLEEDIKIESIPLARVSNNSGGTTVIIGG